MNPIGILAVLASIIGGAIVLGFGVFLLVKLLQYGFKGVGWLFMHLAAFIGGEFRDVFRFIGSVLLAPIFALFVILNVVIGRWSAAGHFGKAFQSELSAAGACLYRIGIGHPARLLLLNGLTDGLENRLPQVLAEAPGRDKPSARTGVFDGYKIIGSLRGGGSGGKLYIATPDDLKRAALERSGERDIEKVVIKAFSLDDGSSLPQIVRESRALDAAKKLGLVLEHQLDGNHFHYVMRYVPGDSLGVVTQNLHAKSEAAGLKGAELRQGLSLVADLVRTLDHYHRGGLWHKDVKPDNIICDSTGAHLVDFGLVTPLRSAMTLTTHGTEYFRDPELVRMALKGAKVHEVDGARFDLYAAGAVLYSLIENSFPAHGGLSQVSKRCPDAIKWIVRRAMTDYDKRYRSAAEMQADLEVVIRAEDPFAVKPAALPSMSGEAPAEAPEPIHDPVIDTPMPAAPIPPVPPARDPADLPRAGSKNRPKVKVANWWTGRYVVDGDADVPPAVEPVRVEAAATPTPRREAPRLAKMEGPRASAREQLQAARGRAAEARRRARARMAHTSGRRLKADRAGKKHGVNMGVVLPVLTFIGGAALLAGGVVYRAVNDGRNSSSHKIVTELDDEGNFSHTVSQDGKVISSWDAPEMEAPTQVTFDVDKLADAYETGLDQVGEMSHEARAVALEAFRNVFERANLESIASVSGELGAADRSADLFGRRVLFISSPAEAGNRVDELTGCAMVALESAGATVIDGISDGGVELLAKAASARGIRPLDSDAAASDLRAFVADESDIDLLLWIEPALFKGKHDRARIVLASDDAVRHGLARVQDCNELPRMLTELLDESR